MSCFSEIDEKNYLFFNDIDKYIGYTEEVENDKTFNTNYNFCGEFSSDNTFSSIENVVDICKQFVALYDKHSSLKHNLKESPSYKSDCEYMNYWLNAKLNNNNNNPIFVNLFYKKIKTLYHKFDEKSVLEPKIYEIKRNELKFLNLLYNLHHKYYKIYNWAISQASEKNENCAKNSEDFVKDYIEAVKDCSAYETDFCKILCNLREKYNNVFTTYDTANECKAKDKRLQTYDEIYPSVISSSIKIDRNTMSIPLLGPIIGLLFILTFFYKFTAIGPWLRNKVRSIFSRDSNKHTNRNELLLQNFDKQNIYARRGVYNITYNSARNN